MMVGGPPLSAKRTTTYHFKS